MRKVRWLVAFAIVALIAPAFGQDAVTLSWKFQEGKPFYQESKTETKQTMKVMNSDITQKQDQTFYFSWTPVKKDGDNWVLKQEIVGVKMRIEIGGQPIEYDSTKESQASSPLGDFFKALVGSSFNVTVDKNFKVVKIEGREDFVKKLSQQNPQMDALLKQILNDEALREMADPAFAAVPPTPKKVNESWEKVSKIDMGPIGRYENTYKYTYEGKDKQNAKLDRIRVEPTLKYVPPSDNVQAGGLPFRIKGAELTSKNSTGTVLFDAEKGRLDSWDTKVELDGKLSIEIGGQTTEVKLNQTQSTTVKTTDTNPVAAAAPKKP